MKRKNLNQNGEFVKIVKTVFGQQESGINFVLNLVDLNIGEKHILIFPQRN